MHVQAVVDKLYVLFSVSKLIYICFLSKRALVFFKIFQMTVSLANRRLIVFVGDNE